MLSVDTYLDEVLALVDTIADVETVPLFEAHGRTLAADVRSRCDVPAWTNSAMDGFAVQADGLQVGARLREVADVPAGSADDPAFGPGECVRIMTGAPLPSAADTVIPRELVTEGDGEITVNELVDRGRHVRHAGEDLRSGDVVLTAGTRLGVHEVALAASCGAAELTVRRRPRVAIISTGDELVEADGELTRGQIFESNRWHLSMACERDGAHVITMQLLPDDPVVFTASLDGALESADLAIMSGGVSVGDHDVVRQALGTVGGRFVQVAMQPGKPQGHAVWNGVPVLMLPGNPLSSAISYDLFVRAVIERMLGMPARDWGVALAAEGWQSPPRRQFIPVVTSVDEQGRTLVRPAHDRGSASHMVSALTRADAIAVVPETVTGVQPGDVLQTRSLR